MTQNTQHPLLTVSWAVSSHPHTCKVTGAASAQKLVYFSMLLHRILYSSTFWSRRQEKGLFLWSGSSNSWQPASQSKIDQNAPQTLIPFWADRLGESLKYDITPPNEPDISLITSRTCLLANLMQGLFCTTSGSPVVSPSSPSCCHSPHTELRLRA